MARHRSHQRLSASPAVAVVEEPAKSSGEQLATGVFLFTALVWFGLLMAQQFFPQYQRWMLYLIPAELVSGWFDGPVSCRGLGERLGVLGLAIATLVPAWLGGTIVVRSFLWSQRLQASERQTAAVVAGLGLQATVLLACGWLGWLRTSWLLVLWPGGVLLLGATVSVLVQWARRGQGGQAAAEAMASSNRSSEEIGLDDIADDRRWGTTIAHVAFLAFAIVLILRAMMPAVEYDVREYHLQGPKEWWQQGAIAFMPHNIYANMPMGAEVHSLASIAIASQFLDDNNAWWWGILGGKTILASYWIFAALLIGAAARLFMQHLLMNHDSVKQSSGELVWVAAWMRVVAIAFPGGFEGGMLGLVEPALACFLAWGLLAWIASSADRWGWQESFLSAAFAGGCALACKYPALLSVVPTLSILVAVSTRRHWHAFTRASLLRTIVIGGCCAMVAGGLWYVKNWLLAGNPLYPLLGQWFGGMTLNPDKIQQWNQAHAVPGIEPIKILASLAGMLWKWRLQGWLLVPLVIGALPLLGRAKELRVLLGCSLATIVLWLFVTHRLERFLVPAVPLFCLFAAGTLPALRTTLGSGRATAVLATLAFFNAYYVSSMAIGDLRMGVDLGYLRNDDGTASSISRLSAHNQWVNQTLDPQQDRLLVVGDAAVLDYEVPIRYSTTFDRSPLMDLVEGGVGKWQQQFANAGYTYILVHWREIERLRSTYGFEAKIDRQLFADLVTAGIIEPVVTELDPQRVEVFRVPLQPTESNKAVTND